MNRESLPQAKYSESNLGGIGYTDEFREMLKERPGIVKSALELMVKAEAEYAPSNIDFYNHELSWNNEHTRWDVVKEKGADIEAYPYSRLIFGRQTILKDGGQYFDEKTGIKLTILGKTDREFQELMSSFVFRHDITSYFKLEIDGHSYFIKKSTATITPGDVEFKNTIKAKEALKDLEFVKVVDAQLGYSNGRQSLFISKWEEMEGEGFFPYDSVVGSTPNDYGEMLDWDKLRELYGEKGNELKRRVSLIRDKLEEAGISIRDLDPNLLFHPETFDMYLLDVTVLGTSKRDVGQHWSGKDYEVR